MSGTGQRGIKALVEHAVADELAFHLEASTDELIGRGLDPAAARREAARRLGDRRRLQDRLIRIGLEHHAQQRREALMDVIWSGLASAARELRRNPGPSVAVVLTLALGIGANAVTFGLVDRLLLQPPAHVEAPEQVRQLYVERETHGRLATTGWLAYLDAVDLEAAEGLTGVVATTSTGLLLGRGEGATTVPATIAGGSYFDLLGTRPLYGRLFGPADDRPGAPPVAVVSHAFFTRHLGGDPEALGRPLDLGQRAYTVIGVAPPGFTGAAVNRNDVWLPLHTAADETVSGDWQTRRGLVWLQAIVRLAPGVEPAAAEAEATTLHRRGRAEDERYDPRASIHFASLVRARGPGVAGEVTVTALLAGVSLLVFAIACANVANLLLARTWRRRREISVRLALGIGRARLVGEQVVEGLALSLAGGLVALAIARWGGDLVRGLLLPQVAWLEHPAGGRVVLFTLAAAAVAGLAAALMPALEASRTDVVRTLQSGGGRSGTRGRSATRIGLLIAQGALSVMLLVGSGLFVRSLDAVRAIDLGIDLDGLVAVWLEHDPDAEQPDWLAAAAERLRGLPGVARVASSTAAPMLSSWAVRLRVPGLEERPRVASGGPYVQAVSGDYFETVGLAIRRGRAFGPGDRRGAPPVTVVNEAMATLYWPAGDALGQCLLIGPTGEDGREPPCTEVVGIAENAHRQEVIEGENLLYYLPRDQGMAALEMPANAGSLLVRLAPLDDRRRAALVERVRREVLALVPAVRYVGARPLEEVVAPQLRPWRLGASVFSAFGLLALLVAAVGLYSVLAFDVAGRTHELGVRSALGASRRAITAMVMAHSLRLAAAGVAVGLLLARLLAPRFGELLYGVSPSEPAIYGGAAAVLMAVALAAAWAPARRASRVEPTCALRDS